MKPLGFWACVALVAGNMIGSGIFLLPTSLAPYGGLSLVGWGISALGALFLADVFGRLSRLIPQAGGPYAFARAGFGDFMGFWVAWGYWFSVWCGNAAIVVALVGYLAAFFPSLAQNGGYAASTAIAIIWALTALNAWQIGYAGRFQVLMLLLKLLPLAVVVLFGWGLFQPAYIAFPSVPPEATSWSVSISNVVTLTLWAFLGIESATIPAQHVHQPEKTIPRATFVGTALVMCVNILASTMVQGVLAPHQLASSSAPFADAAGLIFGDWGKTFISLAAVLSCLGALNGWVLLQGQMPEVVAKEGLFPRWFAQSSARNTPVRALVLSSVLVSILLAMNYTKSLQNQFNAILLLSTLAVLIPYAVCCWVEIRIKLRAKARIGWQDGLRVLGAFGFTVWAIIGSGATAIWGGLGFMILGLPVYALLQKTKPRP